MKKFRKLVLMGLGSLTYFLPIHADASPTEYCENQLISCQTRIQGWPTGPFANGMCIDRCFYTHWCTDMPSYSYYEDSEPYRCEIYIANFFEEPYEVQE